MAAPKIQSLKRFYFEGAVPTTTGDISASKTIRAKMIRFRNSTTGDVDVTLSDKQGTAVDFYKTTTIKAKSVSNEVFPDGFELLFLSGMTHIATATGVHVVVGGFESP